MKQQPTPYTMIANGALVVVNHSGGKDSQAMMNMIADLVPAEQILVIHATLGDIEWPGTIEHIEATIGDLPLVIAKAKRDWWTMVADRGMWPGPAQRQCTSDLKRGPIEREVRHYLKAHPRFGGQVVNCMGLRAGESAKRAKAEVWKRSTRNSKAGRAWYDWLPIHGLHTLQVFTSIAVAGQDPHWAYQSGMTRLSCSFCIMASRADLKRAAELRPAMYARYCEVERAMDHTFTQPVAGVRRFLPDVTGIQPRRTA